MANGWFAATEIHPHNFVDEMRWAAIARPLAQLHLLRAERPIIDVCVGAGAILTAGQQRALETRAGQGLRRAHGRRGAPAGVGDGSA